MAPTASATSSSRPTATTHGQGLPASSEAGAVAGVADGAGVGEALVGPAVGEVTDGLGVGEPLEPAVVVNCTVPETGWP
ncbi:MAG: hypothetical protein ACRCY8_07460, partial [Dermatophilaceae bacterium]